MDRRSESAPRTPGFGPLDFLQDQGLQAKTPQPPVPTTRELQGSLGGRGALANPERPSVVLVTCYPCTNSLAPKIAWGRGHGARKLLFNISAAGGSRLGIRNHY